MFALGIHYLTGYATATSVGSRDEAEWPPHPGRIFMALVAALYETKPTPGDADSAALWQQEQAALEWLEALAAPALKVSEHFDRRTVVTSYVPVNDKFSFPANKQPRTFPKVRPHDPNVFLIWQDTSASDSNKSALQRLCSKVTRIGHAVVLPRQQPLRGGLRQERKALSQHERKRRGEQSIQDAG